MNTYIQLINSYEHKLIFNSNANILLKNLIIYLNDQNKDKKYINPIISKDIKDNPIIIFEIDDKKLSLVFIENYAVNVIFNGELLLKKTLYNCYNISELKPTIEMINNFLDKYFKEKNI